VDDVASSNHAMISKMMISATSSQLQKPAEILRDKVAKTFGIGLETAERTLKVTTQLAL
jgi:hypothetical protein